MANAIDLSTWINIAIPNIRNGDLQGITDMAPTQYLPTERKWVSVRGATHDNAESLAHLYIMAQYGQLVSSFDYANETARAAKARKIAIIMGSVRCSAYGAHRLTSGDMTRAETVLSGLRVSAGMTAEEAAAARDAMVEDADLAEEERAAELAARRAAVVAAPITVDANNGAQTSAAQVGRERSFGALTALEQRVARIFFWMAPAIPLLQGVSLIHSGHHYIKGTYNMFEGLVKQAGFLWSPEVNEWLEPVSDEWKGVAFHDATHPIVPDRKRSWARSHLAKERLALSGHKASIIRLPGLPAESQALKAGLAVITKAKSPLERLGARVEVPRGAALLSELEGTSEGQDALSDEELKEKVKASVTWYEETSGHIAYCAGVVDGLHAAGAAESDRRLPTETTTKALSVQKAIGNQISMYVLGLTAAKAIMSIETKKLTTVGKIDVIISA